MLEIIVPATTANIGPGFDTLGLALNLYNKFYISEIDKGLIITGCNDKYKNENNLVYTSMLYFYNNVKPKKIPNGIKIHIDSNIPLSRGLGSSATCIVAGLVAANILSNSNLNKDDLLKIATEIEGHPDNIAPALFGNMVVSLIDEGNIYYNIIKFPDELSFCAIIPSFELSTSLSRNVLPSKIKHRDAVYNISRTALLVTSLMNRNFDLIKIGCKDKLHQNYRGELIENYFDIINMANNLNCIGTFLSGAGPTIMSIINENDNRFLSDMESFLSSLNKQWYIINKLNCDTNGTIVNIL